MLKLESAELSYGAIQAVKGVSLEVKAPGGRHPWTEGQRRWADVVNAAGGVAGMARTADEARALLGLPTKDLLG